MKDNKKVKEACASTEMKERIEKVAKILEGVHYKTESDKLDAVVSFVKSTLSEAEIEQIANTLRPSYRTDSVDRRTGVM